MAEGASALHADNYAVQSVSGVDTKKLRSNYALPEWTFLDHTV